MATPRTVDDLKQFPARLGLSFRDVSLFQVALTHRSYLNEHPDENLQDNERLEFLGDAVIAFLAAEFLFEKLPDVDEGSLTRFRAGLVRNERLAGYATAIRLGEMLLMGRGEEESGGRARTRNLSGSFEAIVGALYLDQGMDAPRTFVRPRFAPDIDAMLREKSDKDAKSRLQEWSQVALGLIPSYRVVSMTGPEHAPEFTVEVLIGGEVYGTGRGRSKQAATQAAAQRALTERGLID
jgi:ribonuclease-3